MLKGPNSRRPAPPARSSLGSKAASRSQLLVLPAWHATQQADSSWCHQRDATPLSACSCSVEWQGGKVSNCDLLMAASKGCRTHTLQRHILRVRAVGCRPAQHAASI